MKPLPAVNCLIKLSRVQNRVIECLLPCTKTVVFSHVELWKPWQFLHSFMHLEMAAQSEFKSQSLVWQFFSVEKAEDESATCNICNGGVKRGQKDKGPKTYSTAPLHNHLKRCHTTEYNSAYADCKKKKD